MDAVAYIIMTGLLDAIVILRMKQVVSYPAKKKLQLKKNENSKLTQIHKRVCYLFQKPTEKK